MASRSLQNFEGTKKFIAVCSMAIGVFVLVTFYPTTKIGFFGDDWWEAANPGRMSLSQFLRFYFDPSAQTIWYRPLHGVLLLLEYNFFGPNAEAYHVVQSLLHLGNSLLLFVIVYQIAGRWRLAFISALLYAGFFPGSAGVYGIAVHDPLATLFYLLTVSLWVIYLKTERRLYFGLAIGSFVLALLGKETSAALIVTMVLVDRIFVARDATARDLFRRYSFFAMILLVYLAIEYRVQVFGHFTNRAGYSIGFHIVENALHYLWLMVMPWNWDQPAAFIWLALMLLLLAGVVLQKPRPTLNGAVLLFLSVQAVLAIAPVLGLPGIFFEPRYLYPALPVSAVLIALLFEGAWTGLAKRKAYTAVFSFGVTLLALLHSSSTGESATAMAELNRELRVPFRDIVQQHPSFPLDTYLYFIDPPYLLKHAAPSMFFFRYGSNVSIWSADPQWWGSLNEERVAGLRDHKNAFVYYYDDADRRHEVPVDLSASAVSSPLVPVDYQVPFQLEGYEFTSTTLKRGDALVLLLYWKAKEALDKDYTVFVHLIDKDGQQVAGEDSQPRHGLAPTSAWKKDKLVVDPHILPIPSDVPVGGNYRLEVGLYYLPTMDRVEIVDITGKVTTDTLVIQPFTVLE